jgi:tRNA wybutosine-synthesizing protein 3
MSWLTYKQRKLNALNAAIKDKNADKEIIPLLKKINKNPNLVSLSSCSGRIVLLQLDEQGKKAAKFYAKWHEPADIEELELRLTEYTSSTPLWFRVEPFILHISAKDIDSAKSFLEKIRAAGVKRGGIQTIAKDKVTIEIQGSGYLAMPTDPIREWTDLIKTANKMMKNNLLKIAELEKIDW